MTDNIKQFIIKTLEKRGKLPQNTDIDLFNYINSGYIDSMALIKFVVELESQFDIDISENDIISSEFKTIGGLTSLINLKRDKNE
jgi:acyl carrier protein